MAQHKKQDPITCPVCDFRRPKGADACVVCAAREAARALRPTPDEPPDLDLSDADAERYGEEWLARCSIRKGDSISTPTPARQAPDQPDGRLVTKPVPFLAGYGGRRRSRR